MIVFIWDSTIRLVFEPPQDIAASERLARTRAMGKKGERGETVDAVVGKVSIRFFIRQVNNTEWGRGCRSSREGIITCMRCTRSGKDGREVVQTTCQNVSNRRSWQCDIK